VQLGSFASRANAEALQRQLQGEGFSVYLAPIGSGAAMRYRVRLGPVADRAAAAAIMARLQARQHPATLVPPAG
jgi:cell division septation protein DedD